MTVARFPVYTCAHKHTFKYLLEQASVRAAWEQLEQRYGSIEVVMPFGIREIHAARLLFRAAPAGNPITVIRRRGCSTTDISELHALLGYRGESD